MMFSELPAQWRQFLGSDALAQSSRVLPASIQEMPCYPPQESRFRAFQLCAPDRVRVVILGQDPYHGANQAMGLAFSVPDGVPHPPSLRNLLKEYESDTGLPMPRSGDLSVWAERGVLLLNRILTVAPNAAASHRGLGWECFTDLVVQRLSEALPHCVFCLWGRDAQSVKRLIDSKHSVICGVHPSPLSAYRGFFGSKPFSAINKALLARGQLPLDWSLTRDLSNDGEGHIGQLF